MAAALPRMVGMVLRTDWEADRRTLAGVVAAQLGQAVTAGWGLVQVNSVLARLFADGPTRDKLCEALPSLAVLAVAAVASAMLSAWSTAKSGRLEPQVERAVSARSYTAVTHVEAEAAERPEVQRVLETGKFGTDSARSMLRLSVSVGNVTIDTVAAAQRALDVLDRFPPPGCARPHAPAVPASMLPSPAGRPPASQTSTNVSASALR
ncbi:hypothetical protein MUU72_04900 [Streptomyces sp. RS10V-4]|uniref:hypothetical protein n=1 Tax=Streptomyces rhizoryzae TaxID=2932493 RepID=UPI002002E32B|nr:hypothetical protein [Streptomyces rhizoryzae]MCK7622455.1 hypothetical protein [Streptomyces rhizoryzae]